MQDTLPAAFQSISMEVIYHLAQWPRSLPTPEERGGAALLVNYIMHMRDPRMAALIAQVNEKKERV